MDFGASMFFTDYSITPAELAVALEERGFDLVWAAEHSHIPVPRKTPAPGGELPKRYYDVMDPFVTLTAAAVRDQEAQGRHRHLPGDPARHDPDRQARRLDRPGVAAGASCSASAAAGTRRRWRTTARSSPRACRRCASRSRR